MGVTLREKPIGNERISLYLDFYPALKSPLTGKNTRREFLGLHVFGNPKSKLERDHNRKTYELAETIHAERTLDIQAGNYYFLVKKPNQVDFLAWFKNQAETEKQQRSVNSRNNWMSVYRHLHQYSNGKLSADEVTEDFCKGFRNYLTTAKALNAAQGAGSPIAYNSAVGYFTIFKTALVRAVEAKIITVNPAQGVKRLTRKDDTQREFLSLTELQALAKADCDLPYLKRAALFSTLTGLRYSDISNLLWSDVRDEEEGPSVHYRPQKTGGPETLPINETARLLLGNRGHDDGKVLPELLYSSWQNQKLQQWCIRAGITRTITFHAFRHTFAMLQLQGGTDIYTIAKMMGHQNVATTQIYQKALSDLKRRAADLISVEL
jgi:integrase